MRDKSPARRQAVVGSALSACRPYFATAAAFSCALNILHLAPAIYMMQVYDRVLGSGNHTTLLLLTVLLVVTLSVSAALDAFRARIMVRAGLVLERRVAPAVCLATLTASTAGRPPGDGPLETFEALRNGLTGTGATAVMDLPWVPLHALVLGLMHPALGLFALVAAALLFVSALLVERLGRDPARRCAEAQRIATDFCEAATADATTVAATRSTEQVSRQLMLRREAAWSERQPMAERSAVHASVMRTMRQGLQSLALALGAWLVIDQSASAGIMFASTLLLGRALQPVEQIAGVWRGLVTLPDAYRRLEALISAAEPGGLDRHPSTRPRAAEIAVACERLSYRPAGALRPTLLDIDLTLPKGTTTIVLGTSGSGKSTLLKLVAGALPATAGRVSVADGPVGYVPQHMTLLPGSVAENVAMFGKTFDVDGVAEAAQRVGIHDVIERLPEGYATRVGPGGYPLPPGLVRRIGLARALVCRPLLLVLDEPLGDLDASAETATLRLLTDLQRGGMTLLVVCHRPGLLAKAHRMVVLRAGTVAASGPLDKVLAAGASRADQGRVVVWPG